MVPFGHGGGFLKNGELAGLAAGALNPGRLIRLEPPTGPKRLQTPRRLRLPSRPEKRSSRRAFLFVFWRTHSLSPLKISDRHRLLRRPCRTRILASTIHEKAARSSIARLLLSCHPNTSLPEFNATLFVIPK